RRSWGGQRFEHVHRSHCGAPTARVVATASFASTERSRQRGFVDRHVVMGACCERWRPGALPRNRRDRSGAQGRHCRAERWRHRACASGDRRFSRRRDFRPVPTAGPRRDERRRLRGMRYADIAHAGGGIQSTLRATRAATLDVLVSQSKPRLAALISEAVTTIEIKSGYGQDTATELKQLKVARRLAAECEVNV